MPEWIVPPVAGLLELSNVPEILVHDLAAAELIGHNVRAYYSVDQLPLDLAGTAQKVIAVKLVWPVQRLPIVMGQWGRAFAAMCEADTRAPPPGSFPRLVR